MIARSEFVGIRGIVLDAVGTLIEPVPSVSETYALAACRQGVAIDVGVIKGRFREHFSRDEAGATLGASATDEASERRRWRRIVAGCLPEVPDGDRAFEELWEHFGDPSSWFVFQDVAPAVAALHALGLRVCVASNFDGRLHAVAAGLPELRDWVEPMVISSEVGHRKPHPAFYRSACDRLGLEPSSILSVGDDVRNDVLGPREAGLRSVLIARRGPPVVDVPWASNLIDLADVLEMG